MKAEWCSQENTKVTQKLLENVAKIIFQQIFVGSNKMICSGMAVNLFLCVWVFSFIFFFDYIIFFETNKVRKFEHRFSVRIKSNFFSKIIILVVHVYACCFICFHFSRFFFSPILFATLQMTGRKHEKKNYQQCNIQIVIK